MSDEDLMKTLAQAMLDRGLASGGQAFGSFFLSRFLGLHIGYEDNRCILSFDAVPPLFNPQGSLHGGIMATALDTSMGHLLHHKLGVGTTLEMKIQYLAPVQKGRIRCEASFLRQGRSITFMESRAFREDGEISAIATSTWKLLKPETGPASA